LAIGIRPNSSRHHDARSTLGLGLAHALIARDVIVSGEEPGLVKEGNRVWLAV